MHLKNNFKNLFVSGSRVYGLDLIRAFAIILVFWQHAVILVPNEFEEIVRFYEKFLLEGVSIFFVLSGFLITRILLRDFERERIIKFTDYFNFWKRRWYRTLPAYYVVLIVLIFFEFNDWNNRYSLFVFLANFTSQGENGFFSVSWSLAVEEWYYLLFPVLLAIVLRFFSLKYASIVVMVFIITVCNYLRLDEYIKSGQNAIYGLRQVVLYRLDAIALGGILAWVSFYHSAFFSKLKRPMLYLFFLFLLLNPFLRSIFYYPHPLIHFNFEALNAFLVIPFLSSFNIDVSGRRALFFKGAVTCVSKLSYSIYLVHGSIVLWGIIRYFQENNYLSFMRFEIERITLFCLYFIFTAVLSVVLYLFVEEPFMRIRERRTKS